jgi:hypothetical protein
MAKYAEWQLDETNPEIMLAHEFIEGDGRSGKALVWNLGTLDDA